MNADKEKRDKEKQTREDAADKEKTTNKTAHISQLGDPSKQTPLTVTAAEATTGTNAVIAGSKTAGESSTEHVISMISQVSDIKTPLHRAEMVGHNQYHEIERVRRRDTFFTSALHPLEDFVSNSAGFAPQSHRISEQTLLVLIIDRKVGKPSISNPMDLIVVTVSMKSAVLTSTTVHIQLNALRITTRNMVQSCSTRLLVLHRIL
jgi:hypothetical protein